MRANLFFVAALSLTGISCASVEEIPESSSDIEPVLTLSSKSVLNKSKIVERKDILVEFLVSPKKTAIVEVDTNIATSGSLKFKVAAEDEFFVANSQKYGDVYCGYKNIHRNRSKTKLQQGCLYDQDNDGNFDALLARVGAPYQDEGRFLYYHSEVTPISPQSANVSIPYSFGSDNAEHGYRVALRFEKTKKIGGKKHVILDVVTRKRDQDTWVKFANRKPIAVELLEDGKPSIFVSPMFTAEISHPKNRYLEAKIISIPTEGTLGFKRSLDINLRGSYKPAYQVIGKTRR